MATTNTPVKKTSLVDVLDSNQTVRDNISKNNEGDIYTVGTKANDAANAWWEQHGSTLYPDSQLVSPEEILRDKAAPTAATAVATTTEEPVKRYDFSNTNPASQEETDYYAGLDRTPVTDESRQKIRDDIARQQQVRIDEINKSYNGLVSQENQYGQGRIGSTRAMAARGGLLGSPMGQAQKTNMENYNVEKVGIINDKRNNDINAVWDKIDTRADAAIKAKEDAVNKNITDYFAYSKEQITEAKQNMVDIAKTGQELTTLNPDDKKKIMEQTGYSELVFDSIWNQNLPKNQQKNYKYQELKDGSLLRTGDDGSAEVVGNYAPPDATAGWEVTTESGMPYWAKRGKDGIIYDLKPMEDNTTTINEGDQLVDKTTGAIIAEGPAKTSAAYKEWQDYQRSGGNLDFNAYQTMDANRKQSKTTINYSAAKDTKMATAMQQVQSILDKQTGSDLHASPEGYAAAKAAWISSGYGSDDFDNTFSGYVNPANPGDYSVKWKNPEGNVL